MKHWFWPLLFAALIGRNTAWGGPPLSAESRLVRAAYLALKANPSSSGAQTGYLQAFPKSRDKFLRVFRDEPKYGQLYDGKEYIDALQRLGTTYPAKVLAICFGIENKMSRTADAVAYIAGATVKIGITNPQAFAAEARRLAPADQVALCRFLADEEAIKWDKDYELLTRKIGEAGATGLAAKPQEAKVWRMKQPND